ncbi:MAG: serine hydrolase [Calothrix sp. C42_A2020_038]|nr:serine hydrolase [Calothrix sp. C42_A2020_038]
MSKLLSRRQFLNFTTTALAGFSSFTLASLLRNNSLSAADKVIKNLEARVPVLMRNALIPGLSIAVIRNGEVFWSRGFGVTNQVNRRPVNNDTIFAAASLSKPFVGYAALKMIERGQLELDRPLSDYTAKPYISDPRLNLITVRRILSHTTGFPNWSGDAPLRILRAPGTKFVYSGEGFLYLQKVIEEITQMPLAQYLQQNLLEPLGMNSSSFIWQSAYDQTASDGHDRQAKPRPMGKPRQASAAGSLRTTAIDYAQFIIAMMAPGEVDSPNLSEASLKTMLTPQIKINHKLDWGLGWGLEKASNGNFFWHWGDLVTFKSITVASFDLGTGIVILTNSQNGLKISRDVVQQVIGGQHPAFDFWMIEY